MPVSRIIAVAASFALAAATAPLHAQSSALQTGRAQPITPQERRQGAENDANIKAQYGGAMTGRLASYVEQVGRRIAAQSGLSGAASDFNVTLLDSPVDNAFALPGGYVYVTRDLVALMNDEAELAAVMGHEVAHVAARHSRSRQKRATRNSILGILGQLGVGAIFGDSGLARGVGRAVPQLTQLDTLGFSRSQETQADELGVRYLVSAGYDPDALATMLESLAAQTALTAGARTTPAWASTHPEPGARVQRALAVAQNAGTGAAQLRNRDAFLNAIDGMMYDEDPRQGVIEGRRFLHPELGVAFEAPTGYTLRNNPDAVRISGQGGQASFSTAAFNGNLDAYVQAALGQLGGSGGVTEQTTVNGLPARYAMTRASASGRTLDVMVIAYQLSPSRAVHFTTVTAAGSGPGAFEPMFDSVRRLATGEVALRTRYLRVIKAGPRDTVQSLAARMAYSDRQLERFLVLNRLDANARIAAGQRVKIVAY